MEKGDWIEFVYSDCSHPMTLEDMTYNQIMATPSIFRVPPIHKRKRIPMRTIRALASHIANRYNPEQIILFGSHAYGKPTAWSDVDLLVVMDTPHGEMEAILDVSKSLPDVEFGVDIIVRSRDVLEKRKMLGDWFLREITKKGKVLYERTNQRRGR
jgi:predicted nucleotidyltransferase